MRRDVVGLGVALAVGGLAYGAYRVSVSPATALIPAALATSVADSPAEGLALRSAALRSASRPAPLTATSIAAHVRGAALRHGVPEALVAAVISVESEFNPRAVSHRGALGLMQLMPGTAALLGVRDAFDPRQNVEGGAKHLRDLLDRFGETSLALAAYNAGAQAVVRHGGIPPYPETRAFVARVMGRIGHVVMPAVALAPAAGTPPPPPRIRMARMTPEHLQHGADDSPMIHVVLAESSDLLTPVNVATPIAAPAPAPAPVKPPAPAAPTLAVSVEAP